MNETDNWSKEWNSSTNPSKQRKYRENAPLHVKDKLVSANISPELRDELETRSIPLKTGDRVEIMRGDEKGSRGIVSRIDRRNEKVYVDGVEVEKVDGTEVMKPIRPSNLQVKALNIEDDRRLEKFEVEDVQSIKVEEEEMEEVLEEEEEGEMMQQMQQGESSLEEEDEEETEEEEETDEQTEDSGEETSKDSGDEVDYSEIVSGTVDETKERLEEMDEADFESALEAEKNNKNRKTLIEWLEKQVE